MRSVVVRGVACAFLLAALAGPVLAGSPQYKDVCASGCTYSSVQAAIDSITDSSASNVYTVFIDSGVLQSDNSITTNGKDYINFVGRGMGVSVLQASSNWYSRVANMQTSPDFFDFSDSTNVTVNDLSIDARTTDPGNVSTTQLFGGAKVSPGSGGKITFDGCEIQGIFYAMWSPGSGGLVDLMNSKVRGAGFGVYAGGDKWHIFASDLRAMDTGGTSGTISQVAGLLVYTDETTVWGSHLHAESAQNNQTYPVSAVTAFNTVSPDITVIGSTMHVKITATSSGSTTRRMAAASITVGTGNFIGSEFHYENVGALSQGRLTGLWLSGTATVNIAGCTFDDNGGTGGTSRSDILTPPDTTSPTLRVAGTRVASVVPISGTNLPATIISGLKAVSSQRGAATFSASNTVNVALPVTLPDTNYSVGISGNAGETFWVTSKTTTGFTLRSSKANSTATVDWSVTGCTYGSSSCGF